jgi:hypothetical protein
MPEIDPRLTPELAAHFADLALGHVAREFPNKLDHVMGGPEDARTPRELHPIFYGSYDWHSCVHGYWLLARVLRLFPDGARAGAITERFTAAFTAEAVEAERAYLYRPLSRGFERPYGWAWLLALQAELEINPDRRWADTLRPLARAFARRFGDFLPKADYPIRGGAHANTAFALALALDYARTCKDGELQALCASKARQWYGGDRDCQAWEPSGDDFLSPALMEAECLRRVLDKEAFAAWFDAFLPRLVQQQPLTLFEPARVSDRTDGKIAHLDGLNLSRAWCWRSLARTFEASDHRGRIAETAALRHLEAGLPHVAGDYMGEHWLATYALLALTA